MDTYRKMLEPVAYRDRHEVRFLASLSDEAVARLQQGGAVLTLESSTQSASVHINTSQLHETLGGRERLNRLLADRAAPRPGHSVTAAGDVEAGGARASHAVFNGFMLSLQLASFSILAHSFIKDEDKGVRQSGRLLGSAALLVGSFAQSAEVLLAAQYPNSDWAKGQAGMVKIGSQTIRVPARATLLKIARYSQLGGVVIGVLDAEKGVRYWGQEDWLMGGGYIVPPYSPSIKIQPFFAD